MATLSLCMIVKDEAERLAACLKSAQPIVDEIIIVDTGSTDATPEIAQQFGASVHHTPWNNDFAAPRNLALQQATQDWVLVLDADEYLTPAAIAQIPKAITPEDRLVINLVRQEIGATQSPYSLVSRLFRRHSDLCFSRPYHAMIDDSVSDLMAREPHWQIAQLPNTAIAHDGYRADAIARLNKLERAQQAMEAFRADHPSDAYVCAKLGGLYIQKGQFEQAAELLNQGLSLEPGPAEAYELYYHMGITHRQRQRVPEAIAAYEKAIAQPVDPLVKIGAWLNLGSLKQAQGDLEGAIAQYQALLQADPSFVKGYYNLGLTLKQMGRLPQALAAYQRAVALEPEFADAHQNLGVALLNLGLIDESLKAFRQAIAIHERQGNPSEANRLRDTLKSMGWTV
ncbi:MAG: tetratricopeptide repeat protein [Elainellaceae cyanobacterium]